jgi:CheY-like chemotaxis protein
MKTIANPAAVHCHYCAKSVFHLENDGIEFDPNNGLPLSDPDWTWSRPWDGVIAVAISLVRPEP